MGRDKVIETNSQIYIWFIKRWISLEFAKDLSFALYHSNGNYTENTYIHAMDE